MGSQSQNRVWEKWIYGAEKPDSRFSLFCFPFAGGGASSFLQWKPFFPDTVQLLPVQLPGRENRFEERPFTEAEPLMAALSRALLPLLKKDCAFWGHSMGALVASRFALYLEENGLPVPRHLFLSACPPPAPMQVTHSRCMDDILNMSDGIPDAVRENRELMADFMHVIEGDSRLIFDIRRNMRPVHVPATVMSGSSDRMAPLENAEGWTRWLAGGASFETFSGGHFFPRRHREEVAGLISDTILFYSL